MIKLPARSVPGKGCVLSLQVASVSVSTRGRDRGFSCVSSQMTLILLHQDSALVPSNSLFTMHISLMIGSLRGWKENQPL